MLGVAAQRIAWLIRKPRNNADECHCTETRRDGAQLPTARAICRRAARPWGLPRASRRFAHLISESRRRGHAGLIRRLLSAIIYRPISAILDHRVSTARSCRTADLAAGRSAAAIDRCA